LSDFDADKYLRGEIGGNNLFYSAIIQVGSAIRLNAKVSANTLSALVNDTINIDMNKFKKALMMLNGVQKNHKHRNMFEEFIDEFTSSISVKNTN
jgi:hypothetical protein